jgi:hypothetical protein
MLWYSRRTAYVMKNTIRDRDKFPVVTRSVKGELKIASKSYYSVFYYAAATRFTER